MKTTTKKILETLFKEEYDRSKHWPEKQGLLIEASRDLELGLFKDESLEEFKTWKADFDRRLIDVINNGK